MKLTQNDIFLFQGDSITDGNRGRTPDPNHILGHGFACMVSSKLGADNLTQKPTFINRGQSGDTITKMYARWREDAVLLKPTYINILIGINDTSIFHSFDNEGNGAYKVSGGLHGVGVSVVNALSTWLEVRVWRGDKEARMTFADGVPTMDLSITKNETTHEHGTEVTFLPSPETFGQP